MVKIGQKLDTNKFIKGANNGTIQKKVSNEINFFRLSIGNTQKEFLNELINITHMKPGQLVWQSILFAKKENIDISFLNEYINFITNKAHGIAVNVQKVMKVHESLKDLSNHYKTTGYNIKIKGVVFLYLLNYAHKYLKIDISKYKNFN